MSIDLNRLTIINDFEMPQFARKRTLRIYLPKDYFDSKKAYPVLYMHDGQNVFQNETATYGQSWQVGTSLDKLQNENQAKACIVVAIDSGQELDGMCRYFEYSPWQMDTHFSLPSRQEMKGVILGGEGELYVDFICNSLKPYIDHNFRTLVDRENTFLAGSSMGGLISLYAGLSYSNIFGGIGVFSPAFWFNHDEVFNWIQKQQPAFLTKIYMDIGKKETSDQLNKNFPDIYLQHARQMRTNLLQMSNIVLEYQEADQHEHNEAAWAERFPYFANWLLDS